MSVKKKNCFRSQNGAVIEMTCRPSALNLTSLSENDHTEMRDETNPPGMKQKSAKKILQKRYYFYD